MKRKKQRYVTRAIVDGVNLDLQLILWNIMDNVVAKRKDQLDYLQVFNISVKEKDIKIINRQEQPFIEEEFLIGKSTFAIQNKTVWIIDEREKQIMLFPSDY
ncbi:DUF960 family protein [Bacillus subtilis]|uniref:DUF960 family protein n=1 Tax=Bacillus subtilis TaxID=1423 RepID=UPI003F8331F2